MGTCSLLRQFSSRIPEDFVVVPCDFIPPPSLPLSHLLNKFRVDSLSESLLATTCWHSSQPPEKGSFPEEWGPLPATFPIVWDPSSSTLLHIETPDSLDRNADEIELKLPIISRSVMQLTFDFNLDPMADLHTPSCRRPSRIRMYTSSVDLYSIFCIRNPISHL